MPTKIRAAQIRIDEFIKRLTTVDWTSDVLTASSAAILAKIQEQVGGVTGAMQFRGVWTVAETDVLKKGYVYVFDGSGTAPTGVVLEEGDTLIANRDDADPTVSADWTIVQVNITGAITTANLVTNLLAYMLSGNTNALTIIKDTATGKVKFTVNFPTISNGADQDGKCVSGMSINETTGVITLTHKAFPSSTVFERRFIYDETPTGDIDGENKIFKTVWPINALQPYQAALYVNGIRQHEGTDVDIKVDPDTKRAIFILRDSAYVPQSGDVVSCSYMSTEDVVEHPGLNE